MRPNVSIQIGGTMGTAVKHHPHQQRCEYNDDTEGGRTAVPVIPSPARTNPQRNNPTCTCGTFFGLNCFIGDSPF